MAILDAFIAPIAKLLDKLIPDPAARDQAKLELTRLQSGQELEELRIQLSAIIAEAQSEDPWTSRARPSFLYVMYALLLWSIPMGLVTAADPRAGDAIVRGMTGYLSALPEPLYGLFGAGYLGYTAARQWGKSGLKK